MRVSFFFNVENCAGRTEKKLLTLTCRTLSTRTSSTFQCFFFELTHVNQRMFFAFSGLLMRHVDLKRSIFFRIETSLD